MKIASHKLIGRGLVAAFVGLCGWGLVETIRHDASVVSFLVVLPLLGGLLLPPAIMVLKQRWDQLATVVSGLVCTVLFFVGIGNVSEVIRRLEHHYESHVWSPFAGLIILISVWVLPFKLHAFLKPRLRLLFERQPAVKPAEAGLNTPH